MFSRVIRRAALHRKMLLLCLSLVGLSFPGYMIQAASSPWTSFATGAQYTWQPYYTQDRVFLGNIFVVRIAPDGALFRVDYRPGVRQTVQAWASEMPSAILVINASYFDGAGRPVGLVKLGNDLLSTPTQNAESGMFYTRADIPQILPHVNMDLLQPSDTYSEGFEGYPVLISGQKVASFKDTPTERARRSVIAQDTQGNILVLYTSSVELSLTEMANWIQTSGLHIVTAINLDGGSSSQIHVAGTAPSLVQGDAPVPVVFTVYSK
jgi:exopolysaccharide biosynthesis protein